MTRLDQLLEESAHHHPTQTAVEDAERQVALSYRDLDVLASHIRDALVRAGVGIGDRVGIVAPKSIGSLASIFGVLKAGAAYVPVDASAPPQRNAYILRDCSVSAIVVSEPLAPGIAEAFGPERLRAPVDLQGDLLLIPTTGHRREAANAAGDDGPPHDALAYILYTSGSTGSPKGVMHTHGSAMSFIDWCSNVFEPGEGDRFSSHAPFHFDLSILDIYVCLKHAATLVLIPEDLGKQPLRLAPTIADRGITIWYSTPSILRLLVDCGRMDRYDYSALRLALFAGEVFPVKHLRALVSQWPTARFFNLYGPTETNVCTYFEVPSPIPDERTEPFPIGRTCENDEALVRDEQGRVVRKGEEGELHVRGGSVMRGYWNLPDRTAQAFFVDSDGGSWYRTGDIVKEDADGNYLFLGRRDRMVKRRGYRVELGEIEAALYRHPRILEAGVIALPDEENGTRIKAFVSWSDGSPISLIELKRYCAENLPLYMVPDYVDFRESLPKTSTDKLDYQKLAEFV